MDVLVFVERDGAGVRKSAFEVAAVGADLAAKLGGGLSFVVAGDDVGGAAAALAPFGRVYTVTDPALAHYSTDGYAAAVLLAVKAADPAVVLLASSVTGKDLGPAVAARLGAGVISDAVGVEVADGTVRAVRPIFAGKVLLTVEAARLPVVVALRPNIFEPATAPEGGAHEVTALDAAGLADGIRTKTTGVEEPETRTVDLTEADIVVSGGRGMKGPEHFHLVEELAAALGGVVGASRAVVDAGWRPHSEQVGQTGKTVSPKLYVACGISGAIQHLAGMTSSKCIVAVNKDPEAPIFKVADYGIVGDVMEVLPALTEEIGKKVRS